MMLRTPKETREAGIPALIESPSLDRQWKTGKTKEYKLSGEEGHQYRDRG